MTGEDDDIDDILEKVLEEGQVEISPGKFLTRCLCQDGHTLSSQPFHICPAVIRPSPDMDGMVSVCSGPFFAVEKTGEGIEKTKNPEPVKEGCPYRPTRFQEQESEL